MIVIIILVFFAIVFLLKSSCGFVIINFMIITRHGEASFRVQVGDISVVVDPEDHRLKADVVLKTRTALPLSATFDSSLAIVGPGEYDAKGVHIFGFPANAKGSSKNFETVYKVVFEDLSLVFMGSPAVLPDVTIGEKLGNIDILFAGPGTHQLVKQLDPKMIIATHFKNAAAAKKEFNHDVGEEEKVVIKKSALPTKLIVNYLRF